MKKFNEWIRATQMGPETETKEANHDIVNAAFNNIHENMQRAIAELENGSDEDKLTAHKLKLIHSQILFAQQG